MDWLLLALALGNIVLGVQWWAAEKEVKRLDDALAYWTRSSDRWYRKAMDLPDVDVAPTDRRP